METKKLEILVVEDTPENLAVANQYFDTVEDVNVTYATTFKEIPSMKNFDGVLSDLMFPYDNTGDLTKFRELVKTIGDTIREAEVNKILGIYHDSPDIVLRDLETLEKSAKEGTVPLRHSSLRKYPERFEPYKIEKERITKEYAGKFGFDPNKSMKEIIEVRREKDDEYRANLDKFRIAVGKLADEFCETLTLPAEQPMGILVAEECTKKKTPYLVVTSAGLAHGDVTTPVGVYMRMKLQSLDEGIMTCANKTDIETWKNAYNCLISKIETKK